MLQPFEIYFKSLAGSWTLKREISTGEIFIGKAVFESTSSTVFLMREEGDLTLSNGQVIQASRNWYWHLVNANSLEITYDEARVEDYHLIEFSKDDTSWNGIAHHLCGADHYSGEYKFSEESFEIIQTVKGPKKDYIVSSIYSK